MSCTSKWRISSARRPASRTTANASGIRASTGSPAARRPRRVLRDCRELRILPALEIGLELVDGGHGPAIAAQHALVARPDHSAQDVRHHVLSSS